MSFNLSIEWTNKSDPILFTFVKTLPTLLAFHHKR
jgi:hypothetical protein